ncbi:hypothetical protein DM860_018299 [Cuscuta australis]|uniref:FAR1 domain-containing protein n=1 Tax=Cuscuta australis TaxID=267555 RepID=A0A328E565_9ASTE|nr:hypothetical protein DM860_018299 [Cuscuta australis]
MGEILSVLISFLIPLDRVISKGRKELYHSGHYRSTFFSVKLAHVPAHTQPGYDAFSYRKTFIATPTKYQEVPNEGSSSYVERHWVPQCPDNYIPKVGMVFKDLDDAIRFYRAYAAEAGFDVRKTTTTKKEGSVVWQYVVCSREGKKHVPTISHNDASHDIGQAALSKPGRRRRISKRIGLRMLPSIRSAIKDSRLLCYQPVVQIPLAQTMFDVGGPEMDKVSFTDQNKTLVSRLMSDIHFCIALVEHTPDLLLAFSNTINQHKEALIDKLQDGKLSSDTSSVFENFCGTSAPSEVRVLPPPQVSTKGSGKRIKGGKEVSIEESKKTKRLCRTCKEYGFHDVYEP